MEILTVDEVADILGVSDEFVVKEIEEKRLSAVTYGCSPYEWQIVRMSLEIYREKYYWWVDQARKEENGSIIMTFTKEPKIEITITEEGGESKYVVRMPFGAGDFGKPTAVEEAIRDFIRVMDDVRKIRR